MDVLCIVIRVIFIVKEEFVFSFMLLLFGKDIELNICMLGILDIGLDFIMFILLKDI